MDSNSTIESKVYVVVDFFLQCLNEKDKNNLLVKFEVTETMYLELEDVLNNYFDNDYKLSLIPFNQLNSNKADNMPIFDLDEMDEGEYMLECIIYNYGKSSSLILQGNVDLNNGEVHFSDPLFKS